MYDTYTEHDKRRLYWLIDMYIASKIMANTFCNEFYITYNIEMDHSTLTELEHKIFSQLNMVLARFTDSEEDLRSSPGVYYTEEELREAIEKTQAALIVEKEQAFVRDLIDKLKQVLSNKSLIVRGELIEAVQKEVWHGGHIKDEALNVNLKELACELDFYSPNEEEGKEANIYYGEKRLGELINAAIAKLEEYNLSKKK